jgi:hypothetical protein
VVAIGLGLAVIGPSAVRAGMYMVHAPGREETKPVLAYLAPRLRESDGLYLYHAADASFLYYREEMGVPKHDFVWGQRPTENPKAFEEDVKKLAGNPRVWVMVAHVWGDEEERLLKVLDARGKKVEEFSAPGADLYLYDLSIQK